MAIVNAYPDQAITLGGSAFTVTVDSVGTTAAAIVTASATRSVFKIKNTHETQIIYLGADNTVAANTGYAVAAGETVEFATTAAIYGIASGAATTYQVLEVTV